MEHGTLFVVATPIGNRDDLTPRARQVLGEVDVIAAEDTRHTGRLLSHFGIKTPLLALHEHNEAEQIEPLVARLQAGVSIALVSDAGTPLISDPGYRLVAAAHEASIPVSPLPGASAVMAALSVSGLPTDRFTFEGFLPARTEARQKKLDSLAAESRTMVFLESVHKVRASIPDMVVVFGAERPAFLGRELTKLHEQCLQAPLSALVEGLAAGDIPCKGEFVLIVAGRPDAEIEQGATVTAETVLRELLPHLPGKQATDIAARLSGERRNDVYAQMLKLKGGSAAES